MSAHNSSPKEDISAELERLATQLRRLELVITTGEVDARPLQDFREAMDYARTTAWAVQQTIKPGVEGDNGLGAFSLVVAERVRRVTEMSKRLLSDLDPQYASRLGPGIERLFSAVKDLYNHLIFLREQSKQRPSR